MYRLAKYSTFLLLTLLATELMVRIVFVVGPEFVPSVDEIRSTLGPPIEQAAGAGSADPAVAAPGSAVGTPWNEEESPGWLRRHVLHPYVGYTLNRSSRRRFGLAATQPAGVNRLGFLGPSPLAARREGARRVALTGGSVAYELFSVAPGALTRSLAAALDVAPRDIELVSLAIDGFKQPQQFTAMANLLALGAEIDLVVNLDGFNEGVLPVHDNLPVGIPLAFPRRWDLYSQTALSDRDLVLWAEMVTERLRLEAWRQRFDGWWGRYSYSALLVWHNFRSRSLTEIGRLETQLAESVRDSMPPLRQVDEEAALRRAVEIWAASSIQLSKLCAANGIGYMHALQPNQYLEGSKRLTEFEREFATGGPYAEIATKVYPMLVARGRSLREEGVEFVDLTGIFSDVRKTLYRDRCCHLNPEGYSLLAAAIGRAAARPGRSPRAADRASAAF